MGDSDCAVAALGLVYLMLLGTVVPLVLDAPKAYVVSLAKQGVNFHFLAFGGGLIFVVAAFMYVSLLPGGMYFITRLTRDSSEPEKPPSTWYAWWTWWRDKNKPPF